MTSQVEVLQRQVHGKATTPHGGRDMGPGDGDRGCLFSAFGTNSEHARAAFSMRTRNIDYVYLREMKTNPVNHLDRLSDDNKVKDSHRYDAELDQIGVLKHRSRDVSRDSRRNHGR